jgi:hypothetical protein
MKNTARFLILISLFVFVLSACQPRVEVKYVEGDELAQVSVAAAPIAEHILAGLAANDYGLFSTDFDPEMKTALSGSQFDAIVKSYGGLGQPQSTDLLNVEDKDAYYGVNFKVTYADKVVLMLVVLPKADSSRVSGLWFK